MLSNFERTSELEIEGDNENIMLEYLQKCMGEYDELRSSFGQVEANLKKQVDEQQSDQLGSELQFIFFEFLGRLLVNYELGLKNIELCQRYEEQKILREKEEKRKEIEKVRKEVDGLEEQLKYQKMVNQQYWDDGQQYLEQIRVLQSDYQKYVQDCQKLEAEIVELKQSNSQWKEQNDQLVKMLANVKPADINVKQYNIELKEQCDQLKQKYDQLDRECKEQKRQLQKMKDRETKLMKLLSAIMEKGVDIESIYIQEVMEKKKDKKKKKQNMKDYQQEIEEIPEMDEEYELSSRNKLYSLHQSLNQDIEYDQEIQNTTSDYQQQKTIYNQQQQNTTTDFQQNILRNENQNNINITDESIQEQQDSSNDSNLQKFISQNGLNINLKVLKEQCLPKLQEKFTKQKPKEDKQCQEIKDQMIVQANNFWEISKKKKTEKP